MGNDFKKLIKGVIFTSIFTLTAIGTVAFAISFPTNSPTGETIGGKFMSYFDKILVNTDLATTNGMVKDSDKVDGLHAADLAGGLGAAGEGTKTFRLVNTDMGDTFTIGSITCTKLGAHIFRDGGSGNYYYNNEAKSVQAIAGAGCMDRLYSFSYGGSNMIYCSARPVFDYLCSN